MVFFDPDESFLADGTSSSTAFCPPLTEYSDHPLCVLFFGLEKPPPRPLATLLSRSYIATDLRSLFSSKREAQPVSIRALRIRHSSPSVFLVFNLFFLGSLDFEFV